MLCRKRRRCSTHGAEFVDQNRITTTGARAGRWQLRRLAVDDTGGWIEAAGKSDLLWLESPSNPLLTVADLDAILSAAGFLNAWIDFNADGDWDDAGEQIFTDLFLAGGLNSLDFLVPADAIEGDTYARFRLDSGGGLTPYGLADDGEVEDYEVEIVDLFRRDFEAVGGAVLCQQHAVAVVDQAAGRRQRQHLDAVFLRQRREVFVIDDLERHQAPGQHQYEGDHEHPGDNDARQEGRAREIDH